MSAQSETTGCNVNPYTVIQIPTRMKTPGTRGHAKLTAGRRCQSGRRRKMNNDATDMHAKKFKVTPMYVIKSGNGVKVIAMAQTPWQMMAITGVFVRGSMRAATGKNAPFLAI